MKIIFLTLILFFTIYSLSQSQTNCVTPACYGIDDDSCQCTQWSAWEMRTDTISMAPEFPLCTLYVSYCYRQCINDYTCTEIYIKSAAPLPSCYNTCHDWIDSLNSGSDWEKARKIKAFLIFAYRTIVFHQWFKFLDDTPEQYWPYCPDHRNKYFSRQANCTAGCFTQHPIGDPNNPMLITFIPCVDQGCCIRKISLCVDPNTGETISNETTHSVYQQDCSQIHLPGSVCPPGENVSITDCIDDCGQD